MNFRSAILAFTLLLMTFLLVPVSAQEKAQEKKEGPRPDFPLAQWLAGPDRKDFKWNVELLSPHLTFQQRNLVQVRAFVDVAPFEGTKADVYFVLKVADAAGKWLAGETYNHFPIPPGLDKSKEVQYSAGFYAKPGRYTVALILYDTVSGQGNVWRKQLEVKAPKNDPLPDLDRNLPEVEFLSEVPSDTLPIRTGAGFNHGRRLQAPHTDGEWPPGHGIEELPVHTTRPVRVDVVLNMAPWVDPYLQRSTSPGAYRDDAGRMLQVGALLSHLKLDHGCVRVSAIDLSKLEVVLDPVDGHNADWDKLADEISKRDHDTISVDVLSNRKSTAGFLRDYLGKVFADRSGCGQASEQGSRALIFVSHDFAFPAGTHGDHFYPDVECACRYYEIRISWSGGMGDDLANFFKPARPRRFDANSAEDFRRTLAQLLEALGGGKE